jgi:electron transfer flavoprotein alpha subunit
MKPNPQGEVWVFAEQEDNQLSDVPLELMGKGRELADRLGVPLAAALLGKPGVQALARQLGAYGADRIHLAEHDRLERYQNLPYRKTLCAMIEKHQPQVVLFGATAIGRDLAPTVASTLKCGLTADCTDLQIGDHTDPRTKQSHENLLLQIRPAFGGSIIATIVNPENWPQMATVREGVMVMPEPDASKKAELVTAQTSALDTLRPPLRILDSHRREKTVDLKGARVIVAGGAGVGSRDNFKKLWDLANVLGGAVAGSRAAVDLGFIGKDHQVGQTGTTVRPALYIACGISGAVQHRAGMEESAKIVAINNDPDAPIFSFAHYGIVGDLNDVLPRMVKAIRAGATVNQAMAGSTT